MYAINVHGEKVWGATFYNGTGKGSDVYLYKAAFASKEQLYLSMGHEYIHANLNAAGILRSRGFSATHHHSITSVWEAAQSRAWNLSNAHLYRLQANKLANFRSKIGNPWKFAFPILNGRL